MINFTSVSVKRGDYTALENITFRADDGVFLSVIGPNGAGKTTLIKAILGVHRLNSGTISLSHNSKTLQRSELAYVPQLKTSRPGFNARAWELVSNGSGLNWPFLGRHRHRSEIREVMRQTGVLSLAERSVQSLSGGELQRVYLARAFLRKPLLLLLDEPATGIDPGGEHDLYTTLAAWQQKTGGSILMSTHDLDVALHHSTHVLAIRTSLMAFGSPSEVMNEKCLRKVFGHEGHHHLMTAVEK